MDRREMLAGGAGLGALLTGSAAKAWPQARNRPARFRPPTVTNDGTPLFVQEWGAGRPVVFTHSLALSSVIWFRQMLHLAEAGCRCIAYDRRGHGRSGVPSSGYDLDTLADDLALVIEGSGQDEVALVGHSMGAGEIIRYLSRHGTSRVAKVALLAPTTPFLLHAPDNPLGYPAAAVAMLNEQWAADFPQWVEDNKRPFFAADTSLATMDWLARLMLATPLPVVLACNRAMVEADHRPDLARIDRPVLVIHGDKDLSAPLALTGRPTASGIRHARLKVYPGAPHGLFVTHAARVNADLADFIVTPS